MIRAALAAVAVLVALAALSWAVVGADRAATRADAVRLALWRLDAEANALVLTETARPLGDWRQARLTPPIRARRYLERGQREPDIDLAGSASAPAASASTSKEPVDKAATNKAGAAGASAGAAPAEVDAERRSGTHREPSAHEADASAVASPAAKALSHAATPAAVIADAVRASDAPARQAAVPPTDQQTDQPADYAAKSSFDYTKRLRNAAQVQQADREAAPTASGAPTLRWLGDDLLLERPLSGGARAQTLIDWNHWRSDLLVQINDLLPAATLRPARAGDPDRLASIPASLDPGPLTPPLGAPTWWMLGGAWFAGLGGLAAVLAAMAAAARLAERRAAFVSAVTHELRTPLTALRLHGDLLADARIADDPARRAVPVAAIRDGATRLAHLIDNVLDYARLERRRPPAPRTVSLDALIPELIARLPGVAIPPLPDLALSADPQAVERILANLADNAGKYGRPPYALTIAATARRVTLTLRDHGPGLAADAQAHLFTPFARSAEAAAGDAPGVGLGLALCRRLARAQGGDLTVGNAPDGGVRAVLTLRRA